jgi:hypothetical protein
LSGEKQGEALSRGEVEIRCKRSGMFQLLTFKVERRSAPAGQVPYLVLDRFLDLSELMRISEEYSLPVQALNGKVYPRGKKESDFAGL